VDKFYFNAKFNQTLEF